MKLILLLIALLIVGLLVNKQLSSSAPSTRYDGVAGSEDVTVPKIPTVPEGVHKFEKDMNELIMDSADKRAKQLEKSMND